MENNNLLIDIERKIRNDEFKNKEELNNYLKKLLDAGLFEQYQENLQIKKLLDLYDSLHSYSSQPLNMENYKGVSLEEKQFIVSTQDDRVLKTTESYQKIDEEFKNNQNELIASNKGETVTADEVFERMANTQKEELSLVPLTQIHTISDIKIETLQKIKFFINSQYVNPYDFQIDLSNGVFYNVTTKEMFEVRKNEETNQYAIYKGGEIVYRENNQTEENQVTNNMEPSYESEEDKQLYERKDNVKRRVLTPPKNYPSNMAFSKMSFLILNIISFMVIITMIIFLNK